MISVFDVEEVGGTVLIVAPEPLDESWPPPAGFPNAHAAHIVLAAFVTTCLLALRMRLPAPVPPRRPG